MHWSMTACRWRMARAVAVVCAGVALLVLAGCTDGPTQPRLRDPRDRAAGDDAYCGFGEWGDCTLAPITSGTGDNGCTSPATQIDYCQGSGTGGTDNTSGSGTWAGAGGTTSGGGAGTPQPGDTVPRDSCTTGSPVFDDPAFRAGLADLWQKSNADANLAQRKEQFGWVVKTATGFRIAYLGAGNFCGYDGSVPEPPEGYAAVTGFVHTHPYVVGETIISCGSNMEMGIATYNGEPSDPDRKTSVSLGTQLGRAGPLPGLIIDRNGMVVYAGNDRTTDVHVRRCGY